MFILSPDDPKYDVVAVCLRVEAKIAVANVLQNGNAPWVDCAKKLRNKVKHQKYPTVLKNAQKRQHVNQSICFT